MNKEDLINKEVVVYNAGMLGVGRATYKITEIVNGQFIGKIKNEKSGRYGRKLYYVVNKEKAMFLKNDDTLTIERDIKIDEGTYTTTTSTGNFKLGFVNTPEEIKEAFKNQLNLEFEEKVYSIEKESRQFNEVILK